MVLPSVESLAPCSLLALFCAALEMCCTGSWGVAVVGARCPVCSPRAAGTGTLLMCGFSAACMKPGLGGYTGIGIMGMSGLVPGTDDMSGVNSGDGQQSEVCDYA